MTQVYVFQLVYVSTTVDDLSSDRLLDLLESCRENNRKLLVTGMLLYKDHSVIQVLEGSEAVVKGLFQRIARDVRHHELRIIYEGVSPRREFDSWSMGFRDLENPEVRNIPGYADFLDMPLQKLSGTQSRELLSLFKSVGGWLPALTTRNGRW